MVLLGNLSINQVEGKESTYITKTNGSIVRRNLVEINESDSEYSDDASSDDSEESQNNV